MKTVNKNILESGFYFNGHSLRRTLILFVLYSVFSLLFLSCKNKKIIVIDPHAAHGDTYYTCSMHTQIMLPKPGKCPICGMQLIEAKKSNTENANEIQLTAMQIKLGNIQVDTIANGNIGDVLILTATLNFNQYQSSSVSSRVMGRIEKLYFRNIGDYVKKGDRLFDIYSEELNNAKQEYILDLQRKQGLENSLIDFNQLIAGAKNKLLLWGLTEAQINDLTSTGKTTPLTTFYSTASGYITTLDVKEGDYATEGGTIVRLADLSTLWAEAQVYSSQLANLDSRGEAIVHITDMPGKEFKGKIEYVNPEINENTRINLIRVKISNANHQLKPGMPAYVIIKSRQHNTLTLPIDAVLRDGKGATVWVKTGMNLFASKMVETGLETDDRIEIKSGLQSGDMVVISGAYLLSSEYKFKKGANPMAGMKM